MGKIRGLYIKKWTQPFIFLPFSFIIVKQNNWISHFTLFKHWIQRCLNFYKHSVSHLSNQDLFAYLGIVENCFSALYVARSTIEKWVPYIHSLHCELNLLNSASLFFSELLSNRWQRSSRYSIWWSLESYGIIPGYTNDKYRSMLTFPTTGTSKEDNFNSVSAETEETCWY